MSFLMRVVFPAPKNPEKISTFVAISVSFFLLAEINDVVFRRIRDVEVFYLQTRDRDRSALRVVTEESDPAGDLQPLVFREAPSDFVKTKKRDGTDIVGTAGVGLSLQHESFFSVLAHEDGLSSHGDAFAVIALDVVERVRVEKTEVIRRDHTRVVVEIVGEVFPDIDSHIDFLRELPEYDIEMYTHKKMKTDAQSSLSVLRDVLPILEEATDYSNDALYAKLLEYVTEKGYKNGYVMWPIRTALSGKQMTPAGATEILELLGKEESLKRIKKGIEKLSV